jgi:hypothetical protein
MKVYLLISDGELFEIAHLLHDKVGESLGIDGIVTVIEFILHPCTWIVVDHGTAHRELVQVVVGKMVDNLPHHIITVMYKALNNGRLKQSGPNLNITGLFCPIIVYRRSHYLQRHYKGGNYYFYLI